MAVNIQPTQGTPRGNAQRPVPRAVVVAAGALWSLVWQPLVSQWANPEPFVYGPNGWPIAIVGTVGVGVAFLLAVLVLRARRGALTVVTLGVFLWAAVRLGRAALALAGWAPGPIACAMVVALLGASAGWLTYQLLHAGGPGRLWGAAAMIGVLMGSVVPGLDLVNARSHSTALQASGRSFVLPEAPGFVAQFWSEDLLYPYLQLRRGEDEVLLLSDNPPAGDVCAPFERFDLSGCRSDGTGFTIAGSGITTVGEMRGMSRIVAYYYPDSTNLSPETVRSWLREAPVVTPSELIDAIYGQTQVSASTIRP